MTSISDNYGVNFLSHFSGSTVDLKTGLPLPHLPGTRMSLGDLFKGMEQLRWRGQTRPLWSIGEHSSLCCRVAKVSGMGDDVARGALLHDVEEVVIGDVPSPFKRMLMVEVPGVGMMALSDYGRMIRKAILTHHFPETGPGAYELTESDDVKRVDLAVLHAEAKMFGGGIREWLDPVADDVQPLVDIALRELETGGLWSFRLFWGAAIQGAR